MGLRTTRQAYYSLYRNVLTNVILWTGFVSNAITTWWRHQMETFSALMAIWAGNSLVNGEFPTQRPVTRSFDVFFDLRPNERLSKQSWCWWFETLSSPLWRHRNGVWNYRLKDQQWHIICSLMCFLPSTRWPFRAWVRNILFQQETTVAYVMPTIKLKSLVFLS